MSHFTHLIRVSQTVITLFIRWIKYSYRSTFFLEKNDGVITSQVVYVSFFKTLLKFATFATGKGSFAEPERASREAHDLCSSVKTRLSKCRDIKMVYSTVEQRRRKDRNDPNGPFITCTECRHVSENEERYRAHFKEPRHVNNYRDLAYKGTKTVAEHFCMTTSLFRTEKETDVA